MPSPGLLYVDVMSVDTYNQWPFASTQAQFDSKILLTDAYGAPVGIERHRQFAQANGLPLAISEWSSNSTMGDSAVFVQQFHQWVEKNAGDGAGQVPYEILFNVGSFNNGVFQMYPSTDMPTAAAAYVQAF